MVEEKCKECFGWNSIWKTCEVLKDPNEMEKECPFYRSAKEYKEECERLENMGEVKRPKITKPEVEKLQEWVHEAEMEYPCSDDHEGRIVLEKVIRLMEV